MKERQKEDVKLDTQKAKCTCCGNPFALEEVILVDGENLCKDCFSMIEASKDTH
jgi:formylmethanofuran dehydrogenase subunit E